MPRTSKYDVKFAEMKKDIEYIKKSIDENRDRYESIINKLDVFMNEMREMVDGKADKEEFNILRNDYDTFKFKILVGFITSLLAVLGYTVKLLISLFK